MRERANARIRMKEPRDNLAFRAGTKIHGKIHASGGKIAGEREIELSAARSHFRRDERNVKYRYVDQRDPRARSRDYVEVEGRALFQFNRAVDRNRDGIVSVEALLEEGLTWNQNLIPKISTRDLRFVHYEHDNVVLCR